MILSQNVVQLDDRKFNQLQTLNMMVRNKIVWDNSAQLKYSNKHKIPLKMSEYEHLLHYLFVVKRKQSELPFGLQMWKRLPIFKLEEHPLIVTDLTPRIGTLT